MAGAPAAPASASGPGPSVRADPLGRFPLKPGLVICIEPMLHLGGDDHVIDADGWTVRTADGTRAAHEEHMVAITADGPEVLSHR